VLKEKASFELWHYQENLYKETLAKSGKPGSLDDDDDDDD
jgi:hypothetical protein